jgi:WD40 repeat protein
MGDDGSGAPPAAGTLSPYIGLSYYTESDAEWFFGRRKECRTIIDNLRAARLTILYASSGVGKSSLLRAGVARQCRELALRELSERGSAGELPVVFGAWRDDPVDDLIDAIDAAVRPLLANNAKLELPRGRLAAAIAAAGEALDGDLLIILDQFEEYFLYRGREPAGRGFVDQLAECVSNPRLRANFLIAIREDAYSALGDLFAGKLANVYGNYLQLEYLDRDAARETIVKPIEHFNLTHPDQPPVEIEPQLIEAVLDEVRNREEPDGQAANASATRAKTTGANGASTAAAGTQRPREQIETPYLQLVMTSLWSHERRRDSHVLTLDALRELGGAREIMRAHLDGALASLTEDEYDTAFKAFGYLVTPSGAKIALAASDLAELLERPYDQVASVLGKLASAEDRILRKLPPPAGRSRPADRYELYHDVLADAIVEWRRRVKDERDRADEARERKRLEREKHEAEERTREEVRRRRAFQRLAAGALALLLVAAVLAVIAFVEKRNADSDLGSARSSQVVASAEKTLDENPELSTLLALYALRLKRTPQAEAALRQALPELQELKAVHMRSAVNDAAFSPDGKEIVTASENGTAAIWELASRKRLRHLGHDKQVLYSAAWNRDGTEIVTASKDESARVWDAADGKELYVLDRHEGPVRDAAFSPVSQEVVTADKEGTAVIWAADSETPLHVLHCGPGSVESATWSHDGEEIATTSENGNVIIWNARTGDELKPLAQVESSSVESAAWSFNDKELVTAGEDGRASIWNVEDGQRLVTLSVPEGSILDASFSPDGKEVVTANQNKTATIWEAEKGKQLLTLAGSEGPVNSAVFSAHGDTILTASADGTARLWDASPWQRLRVLHDNDGIVNGAAFSRSGEEIVAANQDLFSTVWNARTGERLGVLNGAEGVRYSAQFSPNGKEIVTSSHNGTATIWNAQTDREISVLPTPVPPHAAAVKDAAFSPNGDEIATASHDGTATVWNARSGESLRKLPVGPGSVESVAWSPDGREIATASEDGTVIVWNVQDKRPRALETLHVSEAVYSVAFSPNGDELATGSRNGTAELWNAHDPGERRSLRTLGGDYGPIYGVQFKGNGQVVTASEDGVVGIWDARTSDPLTTLTSHEGIVFGAAFNPKQPELLMANEDGTVAIWSTELAGSIGSLERIAERRVTHQLTAQQRRAYLPR